MSFSENESHLVQQSATTPVAGLRDPDASQSERLKMINSTPNGYSSITNHKIKMDGQPKSDLHKNSDHKHSDSTKHNSDFLKRKDDGSKHPSSSHSKPKHSADKISSNKPKEHSHEKDKHHKVVSGETNSEHSKAALKNGTDKSKSEKVGKEHSGKHGSDSFKKHEKKDDKVKVKEKHSAEHKEKHKDPNDKMKKHESSKDKLQDKYKDKVGEKSKDKPTEKSKDKHKEKSGEKSKDKLTEKQKDKSSEKLKQSLEKAKEKLTEKKQGDIVKHSGIEKTKDISMKHKVKSEFSPEKTAKSHVSSIDEKVKSEAKDKAPAIVRVKQEPTSPVKATGEYLSDDDVPLSPRKPLKEGKVKALKRPKVEEDSEEEYSRPSKAKKMKTESSTLKKRKPEPDSDYESDHKKPVKKKVKKETAGKAKQIEVETSPKKRGKKEDEQDVWKWWEEEKKEDGVKWKTLSHNGPVFAPLYERVPKNVKFYYDGKHMELSEVTEEVAGFYGRMLDHEYVTKDSFNTNFFKDWRKVMIPEEKEKIKDLKKCNFNDYNVYYKQKSEERKNLTKEEKLDIKRQNEELTEKYGFCIIDGHRQKIGNFKIEPPGLFRGRGEHPKMGMLKRRVEPEDVTINISKEAKLPEAPAGHRWKKVLHDNKVTWLASWNENILNSTKYIMLNPSSKLKGEKDWQKYETARKLKNFADRIRKTYSDDFKSKEMRVRQRAVALYFIDKLALRAGNEKDEDTADTVGCCSLRVEHITLDEEKDGQSNVVSFDFLGKDSIRYFNSVAVEKRAFKNLKLFMENKQPGDDLFDRLNTGILNKYLNELMEGLTAKVFRTYNASKTLQEQLDLLTKEDMSVPEKLLAYNRANRAVAVLCNHQRAVPKTFSKSMENLKNKMDEKEKQIKDFKREVKQAKQDAKNSGSAKDKMVLDKKKKRLQQLEEQLKKLEVQATDKEENKQIALGTSKLNYLDPRISVAWCKKWNVPIEKIYNRTQRDKFRWAIEMAGPDFVF